MDISDSSAKHDWCLSAERRLFKKLLEHKPAGIAKHFQMACIVDKMNTVYDNEDSDFEELLSPEDHALVTATLKKRQECVVVTPTSASIGAENSSEQLADTSDELVPTAAPAVPTAAPALPTVTEEPRSYQPIYRIRPDSDAIWSKLADMFDLDTIDSYEYFPPEFKQQIEFFLPEDEFGELMKAKEERSNSRVASSVERQSVSSAARPNRRRRRDSGDAPASSSRSSTPSWKESRRS